MRLSGYVDMAKLSGLTDAHHLSGIAPNLLPFRSHLSSPRSRRRSASVGLEAMGLGPQNEPTLGMTIF